MGRDETEVTLSVCVLRRDVFDYVSATDNRSILICRLQVRAHIDFFYVARCSVARWIGHHNRMGCNYRGVGETIGYCAPGDDVCMHGQLPDERVAHSCLDDLIAAPIEQQCLIRGAGDRD